MLKYTDITQNTYIQSCTVTEIMAKEKYGLLAVPPTVPVKLTRYPYQCMSFRDSEMKSTLRLPCKVLGTLKDDCGVNVSVYVVQFNGCMSLIR
jgi:hypothetical protein